MPQARARVAVVLDRKGGLAEDLVVNTYHFEADQSSRPSLRAAWDDSIEACAQRLVDLYQALDGTLAASLSGTAHVKCYDTTDEHPAPPRFVQDFDITPASTRLPAEVACVVRFLAAPAPGVSPARRRGRIYWGPLSSAWMQEGSTAPDARIDQAGGVGGQVCQAFYDNLGTGVETNGFRHAIYSRATDTGPTMTDAAWNDVLYYEVDNAFDTQRRRGARPTAVYRRP